jgi:hypothetical protein
MLEFIIFVARETPPRMSGKILRKRKLIIAACAPIANAVNVTCTNSSDSTAVKCVDNYYKNGSTCSRMSTCTAARNRVLETICAWVSLSMPGICFVEPLDRKDVPVHSIMRV